MAGGLLKGSSLSLMHGWMSWWMAGGLREESSVDVAMDVVMDDARKDGWHDARF